MRAVLLVLLAVLAVGCGVEANTPRTGAVSSVERLYACVGADGHARGIRAYTPACPGGQVVSWKVSPG